MTQAVQQILEAFEGLTEAEKQQAAAEVWRRAMRLAPAEMPEEAFLETADALFRELDAREVADARP